MSDGDGVKAGRHARGDRLGRRSRVRAYGDRGNHMAYGVVHKFAGGTKEQYEASIAAVHPEGGGLPEGQLFHAAGSSTDGWTIIAVHDSREGWERFRDGTLMPRMAQGIAGGFTAPPEETGFEIYNKVTASPRASAPRVPLISPPCIAPMP